MSRQITAAEFKAKCLKLMDEVAETGEAIVITKRGKPVARLEAERASPPRSLFDALAGTVKVLEPSAGEGPTVSTSELDAATERLDRQVRGRE